jgi:hypothetical protein
MVDMLAGSFWIFSVYKWLSGTMAQPTSYDHHLMTKWTIPLRLSQITGQLRDSAGYRKI